MSEDDFNLEHCRDISSSYETNDEISSSDNETDRLNATNSEKSLDGFSGSINLNRKFTHMRCFAHTLQLVVKLSSTNCRIVRRAIAKCFSISA